MENKKIIALYVRVSTNQQNTQSQIPDLKRWIESQDNNSTRISHMKSCKRSEIC